MTSPAFVEKSIGSKNKTTMPQNGTTRAAKQ